MEIRLLLCMGWRVSRPSSQTTLSVVWALMEGGREAVHVSVYTLNGGTSKMVEDCGEIATFSGGSGGKDEAQNDTDIHVLVAMSQKTNCKQIH